MRRVQDAFGTLIWIVAAVAAVIAIFTLATTGKSYRAIGGAGLAPDDEDSTRSVRPSATRRSANTWLRATRGGYARATGRWMSRPRSSANSVS